MVSHQGKEGYVFLGTFSPSQKWHARNFFCFGVIRTRVVVSPRLPCGREQYVAWLKWAWPTLLLQGEAMVFPRATQQATNVRRTHVAGCIWAITLPLYSRPILLYYGWDTRWCLRVCKTGCLCWTKQELAMGQQTSVAIVGTAASPARHYQRYSGRRVLFLLSSNKPTASTMHTMLVYLTSSRNDELRRLSWKLQPEVD